MEPFATQQFPGAAEWRARDVRSRRRVLTVVSKYGACTFSSRTLGNISVRLFCLAFAFLALLFSQATLAQFPTDPAIYGALPTTTDGAISPDGKRAAFIQNVSNESIVAIHELDEENKPNRINVGALKARSILWANNDTVMLLVSTTERIRTNSYEVWRWIAIDKDGVAARYVMSGSASYRNWTGSGVIYSLLADEPDTILMGHQRNGFSLIKLNLRNGRSDKVQDGSYRTNDWVVDQNGAPLVRVDYDGEQEERYYYVRNDEGDFEKTLTLEEPIGADVKYGLHGSAGAPHLVHATATVGDKRGLHVLDLTTGEIVRDEVVLDDYDVSSAIYDYFSAKVVGATYVDDMPNAKYLDKTLQQVHRDLQRAIPHGGISLTSWSRDKTRFLVRIDYSDHPHQFFWFDVTTKKLIFLAAGYRALDGFKVSKKVRFDHVASDGLTIPGYLTLPAGADANNLPMVVLPHGGPAARSDQRFDYWSSFYAARGYAVYEPNFRGSSGYGRQFREAGHREWGRKMQDDISEGVRKLIADGVANADRICIVGASYGGYAALAGATLTPELYACAVSVNGVSSIPTMIASQTDQGRYKEDAWEREIGLRNSDFLRDVSPYDQAAKARAPILLIHGKDDTVVPIGQSRLMRNALREAGKEYEYVELDGEDHWLSASETRIETLRRSIDFIDRHIGRD